MRKSIIIILSLLLAWSAYSQTQDVKWPGGVQADGYYTKNLFSEIGSYFIPFSRAYLDTILSKIVYAEEHFCVKSHASDDLLLIYADSLGRYDTISIDSLINIINTYLVNDTSLFALNGSYIYNKLGTDRLGINTSSPAQALEVDGNTKISGRLILQTIPQSLFDTASGNLLVVEHDTVKQKTFPADVFSHWTLYNDSILFPDSSDYRILIGASSPDLSDPGDLLTIYGVVRINNSDIRFNTGYGLKWGDNTRFRVVSSGDMVCELYSGVASIERLRIDAPTGYVGINSNNPGSRLDVNGTATMTGFKMTTSPSIDYVLTSDGSGNGTWQPAGSSSISSWQQEVVNNSDNNWTVSFTLQSNSVVSYNGLELSTAQWSGEGTTTLNVSCSTYKYDKIIVIQ